jgi:AbrB family looped-hinge helix DNA binding protein
MTTAVRVQEKGQVTIPLQIRRKLRIKKGDLVTFVETEQGVLIRPAEVVVSELLDEMSAVLQEKGISLEMLMERGRDLRAAVIAEEHGLTDDEAA